MALPDAVKGALRPAPVITWLRADDTAEDLTNATLTGKIRSVSTGLTRAISGVLVVVDGPTGVFRWEYAPGDVNEAGSFEAQFIASFSVQSPGKTFVSDWTVRDSL